MQLSTFLLNYRVGDIVDIKANAAQQKGMPHKFYHGRTGIVYNVTPHAVGVIVNKVVGNRYIEKRVNIRIEHIRHSKCRQEFLERVKRNQGLRNEAKAKGGKCYKNGLLMESTMLIFFWNTEPVPSLRRVQPTPRESHVVSSKDNAPQTIVPVPYETTIWLFIFPFSYSATLYTGVYCLVMHAMYTICFPTIYAYAISKSVYVHVRIYWDLTQQREMYDI